MSRNIPLKSKNRSRYFCSTYLILVYVLNSDHHTYLPVIKLKNSRVFLLHQLWIVNYYVKSSSNNLSNENWCFQKNDISKIVHFCILIRVLSWRQKKNQCLWFHYWDYLTNFWCNNWQSITDVVPSKHNWSLKILYSY